MIPAFMLMQMLIPVAAVGFFGWLALRYVRARERGVANPPESIPVNELRRLEDMISSLQSEVHALRERQEFIEKLLDAKTMSRITP